MAPGLFDFLYDQNPFLAQTITDTMRHTIETGLSFGLTSGIITTLGLMVGLHSGTGSEAAVIGGILTIAIADAFSDALGIHMSEEAENKHTHSEVWEATISTFFFKFMFASTFIIPVLMLELSTAIEVSVVYGLFVLTLLNLRLARSQSINPLKPIAEHLTIALVVVVLTHFVGDWIAMFFG
jgi:VIT1/CCC1 family predicted Fe2+/Mn2+ transporter